MRTLIAIAAIIGTAPVWAGLPPNSCSGQSYLTCNPGNKIVANKVPIASVSPLPSQAQVYYGVDSGAGSANEFIVTTTPSFSSLTDGLMVVFYSAIGNATGAPTINVNGTGVQTIVNPNNTAIANQTIHTGQDIVLVWDQTDLTFQMVGGLPFSSTNNASKLVQRDASGNFSAGTITAALTGHASSDLQASNNLSDVSSSSTAFNNIDPCTAKGGLIYLSASSTAACLGIGSSTNVLQVTPSGLPSWGSIPGSALLKAPTAQLFTSGSGTYTTPTSPSPLYIRVRMVGGGGGGAGNGTSPGAASSGGNTTFGTSLLSANGGTAGSGGVSGAGGTASLGSGPIGIALTGGMGGYGTTAVSSPGGYGGNNPFGGAGSSPIGTTAGAGAANTGAGGAGAASIGAAGNAGGGAGGFVDAVITSPSSTYAYAVGSAGAGGTAGTSGFAGGSGGSGVIIVEEFYQ